MSPDELIAIQDRQERFIWAILEPVIDKSAFFSEQLHLYRVGKFWVARLGGGPEHFGESRRDALAQLAQAVVLDAQARVE